MRYFGGCHSCRSDLMFSFICKIIDHKWKSLLPVLILYPLNSMWVILSHCTTHCNFSHSVPTYLIASEWFSMSKNHFSISTLMLLAWQGVSNLILSATVSFLIILHLLDPFGWQYVSDFCYVQVMFLLIVLICILVLLVQQNVSNFTLDACGSCLTLLNSKRVSGIHDRCN